MLIFEIFLNLICPHSVFSGLIYEEYNKDYDYVVTYEFNDILLFISFIRCYLLVKLLLYSTQYLSPRSLRIAMMNGSDGGSLFAIKCINKNYPIFTIVFALSVTTLVFGYQLKILE